MTALIPTLYRPLLREMVSIFDEIDSLFDRTYPRLGSLRVFDAPRVPADIVETPDSYRIKLSLPGWKVGDLNVEVRDNVVTVSGESRQQESEKNGGVYHLMERRMESFSRSFRLPADVDADRAHASFEDGVLTLTLPKAEHARPKRIAIQTVPSLQAGNGADQKD